MIIIKGDICECGVGACVAGSVWDLTCVTQIGYSGACENGGR